jgi:phosphonate transport system substrate-binding protein
VWVDPFSMAGYVLPRSFLRAHGLAVPECFVTEANAGSYDACFAHVLDGDADLTASFASSVSATQGVDGYVNLTGPRARELRVIAYTPDCPNDALVLSPRLDEERARQIRLALLRLVADRERAASFTVAFGVDGFDEPPTGVYAPLLRL